MAKFLSSALFRGSLSVQSNDISTTQSRTLLDLVSTRTYTEFLSTAPIVDFRLTITDNNAGNNSFYDLIRMNPTINHSVGLAGQSSLLNISPAITKAGASATVDVSNMSFLKIAPVFSGGHRHISLVYNTRAIFIDPTFTGVTASNNFVAFENTRGVVFLSSSSGSVGVGFSATAPLAKLHVRGDSATTGSALIVQNSTPANLFEIRNNGNIGVNQGTDAGFKFDVNGTARISNILTVGSDVATAAVIKNTATDGSLVYAGTSFSNSSIPVRTIIISTVGSYSGLTGGSNLFVGRNAGGSVTSGTSNVFIGKGAGVGITTGGSNVMISSSDATNLPSSLANSIHLVAGNGYKTNDASSIPSATHAFIGGGFNTGVAIKDFYFGQMPFTADAGSGFINIAFYAPSGLGTNIGGANFTLAGGRGTGTATGGNVIISTSTTTTSGTSLQALTQRLIVAATTGIVTITNLAGTGSRMMVADSTGAVSTQPIPTGSLQGAVDADKNSTASLAVGTTSVKAVSATTYTGVFFDYVVKNGTNVRVGSVVAITNGTDVEFYETLSNDIGSTTDLTFTVTLSSGNISLNAVAASTGFTVIVSTRAI